MDLTEHIGECKPQKGLLGPVKLLSHFLYVSKSTDICFSHSLLVNQRLEKQNAFNAFLVGL